MKKFLFLALAMVTFYLPASATVLEEIDQKINSFFEPITTFIEKIIFFTVKLGPAEVPFVLIWLIAGAVFFTYRMRFINIRGFKHAIHVTLGRYDNPKDPGEVTHFQALTAALSGTVGVGNIAGVAIAVTLGGPGATFWMIVAGLLGMSSKFMECTLGLKYRNEYTNGTVSGGPMYYLSKGLAKKGYVRTGKVLAMLFALACIGGSFGGGNMVQVNQATEQLIDVTGGESSFLADYRWVFGLVLAITVGMIIIGGIKSIARVTDKMVPLMVIVYVGAALTILANNFTLIPSCFALIIKSALSADAVYGGLVGVMIQGFKRAAFSNEAGIGSASIAHSAAKTDQPISEGMVSLLEPFIDTVVICTMTALVIVITGYGSYGQENALLNADTVGGIKLTSSAFEEAISWFPVVLSFAVMLFALSTMISWSYYGLKAWTYIFGESRASDLSYKFLFCSAVVAGSAMSLGSVFDFGDAMIFAMAFPNILGLFILTSEVKQDLDDYLNKLKTGEIKRFK